MRYKVIQTALNLHGVRDAEQYGTFHEYFMARNAKTTTVVEGSVVAYLNHGRWVIDCDCGAGAATHPEWRVSRCFACGAVRSGVKFPNGWRGIEKVLMKRTDETNRNWYPGETAADLRAENADHGLRE